MASSTLRTEPAGAALRSLARRVHFVAGLVVAPFLLVLCLTGLVYVFSPQIHDDLYHSQLYAADPGGARRPVAEQVRAALTAHPEGRLESVITPAGVDRTARVDLSVPGLGAGQSRSVFVDPYTNYLCGELTTTRHLLPANSWLRELHSDLHLGEPGRLYAELAASWLPAIVVAGLVLLFAGRSRRRRPTVRELLVPSFRGRGWSRLRGLHGPLGLWLAIGLLAVAVGGLAMSQFAGGRADRSTDPLHAPTLVERPVPVPGPNAPDVGIDRVISASGLSGELIVTPPSGPGDVYTVVERTPGRDAVAVDPYTARVTERIGWADYPLAAKLRTLAVEFHTGTLFGLANQIVVAVLAAGLLVLILLGYRMWWVKNPYQGKWAALPPPAWRQLPRHRVLLVLAALAVLVRVVPVFGASLFVFVAVDAGINAVRGRGSTGRDQPFT
ncbi:PepSY domain-containing protein [Actinophytocola sp.]|uniref:PepSY-associated TM helix domain-containing protein n=1 Tax=Actinophytocola sp. TaxID=1872138 RepID=UPI002D723166|nr:PepSY domain-containing protein [Actinophytocola sp.]HYQ62578.1 PepSY domain-containing protein [Actinophytocola sp.]